MVDQVNQNQSLPKASYVIRKGDTLSTISKATGINIFDLAKDNNIKDVNKIKAGDTISLNYHPEEWETINGHEMNEIMPNPSDQVEYFARMDAHTQARYDKVAKDGAQKHIDTKW